jgi:hypothetical protein
MLSNASPLGLELGSLTLCGVVPVLCDAVSVCLLLSLCGVRKGVLLMLVLLLLSVMGVVILLLYTLMLLLLVLLERGTSVMLLVVMMLGRRGLGLSLVLLVRRVLEFGRGTSLVFCPAGRAKYLVLCPEGRGRSLVLLKRRVRDFGIG